MAFPGLHEDEAAILGATGATVAYNVCAWVAWGLRPWAITFMILADAALFVTGRFYVSSAWEQEPGPP